MDFLGDVHTMRCISLSYMGSTQPDRLEHPSRHVWHRYRQGEHAVPHHRHGSNGHICCDVCSRKVLCRGSPYPPVHPLVGTRCSIQEGWEGMEAASPEADRYPLGCMYSCFGESYVVDVSETADCSIEGGQCAAFDCSGPHGERISS